MAKKFSGFTGPSTPTPQPWRLTVVNWGYQIGHGSRVIAAVAGHTPDQRKDPQAYADALLLASAPDLLAALDALLAACELADAREELPEQVDGSFLDAAAAAIAKARGE